MDIREMQVLALEALEARKVLTEEKIRGIQQQLRIPCLLPKAKKHRISAAGRKRIAAAQHRRWKLYRQQKEKVA